MFQKHLKQAKEFRCFTLYGEEYHQKIQGIRESLRVKGEAKNQYQRPVTFNPSDGNWHASVLILTT